MKNKEWENILASVKRVLKEKHITYKQLADFLQVSEQTMKRFFKGKDSSFHRLCDICQYIGVSVFDIMDVAKSYEKKEFILSQEEELFLAEDIQRIAIFRYLHKGYSIKDIENEFSIKKDKLEIILQELEQEHLLERHPNHKIKLIHSGTHNWRMGGPLQKKFLQKVFLKTFEGLFDDSLTSCENKFLASSSKKVTVETVEKIAKKMQLFFKELRQEVDWDAKIYKQQELVHVSWSCGFQPTADFFEETLKKMGHKININI